MQDGTLILSAESRWVATSLFVIPKRKEGEGSGGLKGEGRQIGSYIERIDKGAGIVRASAHYLIRYPEEKELDWTDFRGEFRRYFNVLIHVFLCKLSRGGIEFYPLERFKICFGNLGISLSLKWNRGSCIYSFGIFENFVPRSFQVIEIFLFGNV